MKRMRFNAQELYVLANISGKESMYGIPDGFERIPDEEVPSVRETIIGKLLDEGIITMDFDGNLTVAEDYRKLVSVYCDCQKCMTVNRSGDDGAAEDLIFWRFNGKTYRAEVLDDDLAFSLTADLEPETVLMQDEWRETPEREPSETIIPQIALSNAKRSAAEGKKDEALRVLRQNGADERTAAVLYDGLQGNAHYLGVLIMDLSTGGFEKTEKAWLSGRDMILALSTTVVNFRTCTVFTGIARETLLHGLKELASSFTEGM